ncbi:hypothetical protein CPT_Percy46 [Caulobacter phage Percy]|uniref:Uncharacterized protein n=1 Tax=Caulobacter phage Percy TaxID=1701809 RepID=A0A0M4RSP4_9CAUD|nr:hypothetical protein CPT_Percy46 [Caulobacter phage Percy]ALF01680.1 hypothetical protein CPT_Percy46 [Caulobacter phage Percy]
MSDYTICLVDDAGVFQGSVRTIGEADGCPPGWVRAPVPEHYPGYYAVLSSTGWTHVPVAPVAPLPVPERISMLQATLALMHFGAYDAVDQAIRNSGDAVLMAYWTRSTEGFERYHPAILMVQAWMGWEDQTMDDMFRFAATCNDAGPLLLEPAHRP